MIATLLRAAWCLTGLLIAAAPVHAAIIMVGYAGTFSSSNIPGLNAGASPAPGFNGSFTFTDGLLTSAALGIPSAGFASGQVVPGGGSAFEVIDGDGASGEPDSILVEVILAPGVLPWTSGGSVTRWTVELVDDEGTAFPPGFPPDLPAFDVWNAKRFSMAVTCGVTEGCTAAGELSSFEVRQGQAVPEPASLQLLIAALGLALWFASRRRPQRT